MHYRGNKYKILWHNQLLRKNPLNNDPFNGVQALTGTVAVLDGVPTQALLNALNTISLAVGEVVQAEEASRMKLKLSKPSKSQEIKIKVLIACQECDKLVLSNCVKIL